jgi:hypothetical protein
LKLRQVRRSIRLEASSESSHSVVAKNPSLGGGEEDTEPPDLERSYYDVSLLEHNNQDALERG